MIYSGLDVTCAKILPIYSPIIPMKRSWRPPNKDKAVARVAHPGKSSLPVILQIITFMPYMIASVETIKPKSEASLSGTRLNPKMPSDANPRSLNNPYLGFPAERILRR